MYSLYNARVSDQYTHMWEIEPVDEEDTHISAYGTYHNGMVETVGWAREMMENMKIWKQGQRLHTDR